jgi:hypothetical protein
MPKRNVNVKWRAEVDESAVSPLISLKYSVGDRAAMPGRSGRQAWLFTRLWPSHRTTELMKIGRAPRVAVVLPP